MKAIVCDAWGPPSSLQLRDLPSPTPGPNQLLVRPRVAAVNFPDALIVAGKYQAKPPFPFSPGGELSGEIIAVGAEVKRLAIGDKVIGLTPYGAWAQEVVVDATHVVPLPADISDDELELAGSFMLTYGTSLHALKDRANAQPGETLLVLGAGGGVGLAAVELGKLLGMRVIAAASTPEKLAAASAHGADECVNYNDEDLRERIKALTDGRGADVVYDPVGGIYSEPALRSIAWRGRFLVVGFANGQIPNIALNLALLKGCSIVGVFWGEYVRREPKANLRDLTELVGMMKTGTIKPLISARYPLADAAKALNAVMDRKVTGKVVLVP